MKILHLPFCLRYLLFLFAFWLLWLGLPMLCWTEMVRVGILVLFQNTAGRLLAFHHLVLYWLWVSQMTSIMMRYVSSISLWWEFLSWILNFIKCFFCIYWDDHVFFFCSFVDVMHHNGWFLYVESSLWPGMSLTWSWCLICFMCCWIQFTNILLGISSKILACSFLFC